MGRAKQNQRVGWTGSVLGAALLALAACAPDRGPYPDLPPLGVQAEFTSKNLCSLGVSPQVRLGGVPGQTATYRWRMTNVSVLMSTPWQTDLPAHGPIIAEGAAPDFPTPCPGELQTPVYRFEIMALDASGRPLAYGWRFFTAMSTTKTVETEQARAAGRLPPTNPNAPVPAARPMFFTY